MPITGYYITDSDAEDRVSAPVWRRVLDDNADGTPDTNPATRLIKASESYVEGFLAPVYSLTVLRAFTPTNCPQEVRRLCLDVLESYVGRRHPGYIKSDWKTTFEYARRDLMDLRKQVTRLDLPHGTAPEPAANVDPFVESGDVDEPDVVTPTFIGPGAMGDF